TDKGLLSDEKVEALETEIKDEIQGAVDRAEEIMKKAGDPLDMFEHAYAEMPPYLVEQREELAKELAAAKQEASDG
ncbi:MAG: pyruvate dehydrogenase (acetyl-transferring) E1 component subunit alpha, partial [Desulfobacteraceae bacterium]